MAYSQRQNQIDQLSGGIVAINSSGTATANTLGASNGIAITNPAAAAGAPSIALDSNVFSVSAQNNVTLPAQYTFSANVTGTISAVTGNSTAYQMIFGTENYDVGSGYNNSTGLFTVPTGGSGKYIFTWAIRMEQLAAGHTLGFAGLITSGGDFFSSLANYAAMRASDNTLIVSGSAEIALNAGDTAYVRLTVQNSTKTVDVGSQSFFTGIKVA